MATGSEVFQPYPGKSAYEIAIESGKFSGTPAEFLVWLKNTWGS